MNRMIEGVDEKLGCEVEPRQETSSDDYTSTIVIRLQPDLTIAADLLLRIHISSSYRDKGGAKVHIDRKLLKYFPPPMIIENEDSSEVQIEIPWMCKIRYPLPVWFFALRSLLRKESIERWRVSVLVPDEFWCLSNDEPKHLTSRSISSSASAVNLIIGVGRNRGRRPYMEDFDILFENMKIDDRRYIAVFGVLDGHGGVDCAQYVSEELPSAIVRCLRSNNTSCAEALFNSFLTTDDEYISSNTRGSNAGSTANVALYDKFSNICYIANTGDTRAVLSRNSLAMNLSFDRKATDPEEIARIVQAGGFVINGRVLGSLAVSRAFGDYQLKTNQNSGCVIVNPEITSFQPRAEDEFMIIATDGLWDVMDSQAAVDYTHEALEREKVLNTISHEEMRLQLQRIADQLAQKAIVELMSADNVTVMIVLFQAVNKVKFAGSGGKKDYLIFALIVICLCCIML